MKPSISSIASSLGLSISTVSRILNGYGPKFRISNKTCQRVLKEAEKCGYSSIYVNKNLCKEPSNTIGLLIMDISNQFFSDLIFSIVQQAKDENYTTIIINSMVNDPMFEEYIRKLIMANVDGLIVVPCCENCTFLDAVNKKNIPVVLIDQSYPGTTLPCISTDNYVGSFNGTRHLIENGYHKIVCIQGLSSSSTNDERIRGYKDAMKEHNLEQNIMVLGNHFSIQNGYMETKILLSSRKAEEPVAIFALNNIVCLGVLKAIIENGLNVEKDIKVMVFDNNKYFDHLQPNIIRIAQDTSTMGMLAVKMLLDKIHRNPTSTTSLKLTPKLII